MSRHSLAGPRHSRLGAGRWRAGWGGAGRGRGARPGRAAGLWAVHLVHSAYF